MKSVRSKRRWDFRKILRQLWVLLKKILRKLVGILVFVVFAALETSDWLSLMAAFGNRTSQRVEGLNPQFVTTYLVVLTLLAMGVLFLACQTIVGILRGAAWAVRTAQATASLFMIYGGFQIYTALTNPGMETAKVIVSGGVFFVIGLAIFGLGKQLAQV